MTSNDATMNVILVIVGFIFISLETLLRGFSNHIILKGYPTHEGEKSHFAYI